MITSEKEIDDIYADIRRRIAGRKHARRSRELELMYQVVRNHVLIRGKLDGLIKPFGMTIPGYNILTLLKHQPKGLILKDLSQWLLVTKANITGLIRSLERQGFIIRVRQGMDRRSWRVALTPKGKKTLGAYQKKHLALISELLKGLSQKELDTAVRILSKWRHTICELEREQDGK